MILGRIPVRTHIITEKDDIVDVVKRYAGEVASRGDIIAVAESVVAITQGRAILPETVQPGLLARFLSRFPGKDGSLATPPAMQLAIRESGTPRILLGVAAAGLGRLIGRRGDFFRVAGRHLAQIDDVAGTMWPFERHIILGPKDPQKVVERIKQATGAEAVVTDVNDIGKVDILAATGGVNRKELSAYLKDNPFGNDDQQTPIVVLVTSKNGDRETAGKVP
ncbi:MAG: coenzyme F420-0:L-glutamate ligase [Firmicutes bacterium]|nr:coenzyme F420-0:L-glutamate ligase [Bacillota bacterium]